MKKLLALLFVVGGVLAFCADIPTINANGSFTATGVVAQTRLQGQSSVSVTNTGGAGNTITVQASNDCTTNWQSVGTVTTAQATQTFSVGASNSGLYCLRLNVTTFGSGTGAWWWTISASVQSSSGGGGATPIPTPAGGVYPVTQASVPWSDACLVVYPCGFPTPIAWTTASPEPVALVSPGAFSISGTVSNNCISNCTPAPTITLPPLATPTPLASPGWPYSFPMSSIQYFWNGSAWVPVTSTAPMPVTTPTIPTPSPLPSITLAPAVVTGPTTMTPLIAASGGKNIYIYYASSVATGTETAAQGQLYYGTTSSTACDTGCTPIGPSSIVLSTTLGQQEPYYAGAQFANVVTGFYPAGIPFTIPTGQGLYVKSWGTTVNFQVFLEYGQY